MTLKNQRKLKNFLINPKFQGKYIFWTTGTGLVLVAANSFLFYRFMKENYMILVDLSPMTDEAKTQLYYELHQLILILVVGSILFLIITSLIGVLFSHRVAGPLYKMKKTFEQITNGDKNLRIHLRPNDEFVDLAETCNKMLDSLNEKK